MGRVLERQTKWRFPCTLFILYGKHRRYVARCKQMERGNNHDAEKVELAEMRQQFMDWTDDATVHEWVRAKLFHIVCTNPKTYGNLKVTRVFVNK